MQRFIISFFLPALLLVVMVSCNKSKEKYLVKNIKENDSTIVYNENDYNSEGGNRLVHKKIKIIDTACINGEERAKIKAKKGVYKYYFGVSVNFSSNNAEYLKKVFSEKGIDIDFYYGMPTCIPLMPGPFKSDCFEKYMNKEFEMKYGTSRVDSIEKAKFAILY